MGRPWMLSSPVSELLELIEYSVRKSQELRLIVANSPKQSLPLAVGDVLLVSRLDRLARSTRDLLNVLATISDRGAGFRSLANTWADTTTAHGRLMLTVLGGLAEFERELIKARTGEGRKRAQALGSEIRQKAQAQRVSDQGSSCP
jgi:DNA invertase Pin-like site-specific DNA recombinase